jgi:hypothetical protein
LVNELVPDPVNVCVSENTKVYVPVPEPTDEVVSTAEFVPVSEPVSLPVYMPVVPTYVSNALCVFTPVAVAVSGQVTIVLVCGAVPTAVIAEAALSVDEDTEEVPPDALVASVAIMPPQAMDRLPSKTHANPLVLGEVTIIAALMRRLRRAASGQQGSLHAFSHHSVAQGLPVL